MNKEDLKEKEELKDEIIEETVEKEAEEKSDEVVEETTEETVEEEIIEEAEEVIEETSEAKPQNAEENEVLKEEVTRLNKELDEMKQAYIRKQADYQNFTKRKEKEAEEFRKYASEKIIGKLLDGVDNLTRAIDMAKQSKEIEGLIKGVELTLNQFSEVLKAEGLEEVQTAGMEYNPEEHMAVMVEDNPEIENNYIIAELQKGYKLKGRVIRPAMVKVCKK